MQVAFKINMVYTDNPYIDIIVYNTKLLGIDTVLKIKDNADRNETLESKKNADLYIACMDGTAIWELFDTFSEDVLRHSGITGAALIRAIIDKNNIPASFRPTVLKNACNEVISNYEELNNYYRMLYGLPPVGYEKVYVTDWTPPDNVQIDLSVPIHEMPLDALHILDTHGVLDDMYNEDPENRTYLKHIFHRIAPYAARKASPFEALYVPEISSIEIRNEYRNRLEINRQYATRVIYSEAYKYDSDYYDNFIAVFIVLMAMVDVISRVQEFIARKEVFDIRTVRYIFESYGITYFPEIPMKYQIKMVKNLHSLLKYKSTSKCMIDICSLFGFSNIKIFKYYLLRSRKYVKSTDTFSFTGDDEEDFEMKFVKIPIDGNMEDYIRDPTYYVDYDEITSGDPTWDAGEEHGAVRKDHISAPYNYTRTKYLSVDSIYDIAKVAIQQSYFFNMLYDNVKLESEIKINIPYISSAASFNIADIFIFLTCLTYQYNNMKDLIMDTQSKVLSVLGFNFKADLGEIANHLAEILGIDVNTMNMEVLAQKLEIEERQEIIDAFHKFNIPTNSIPSMKQLMALFVNNLEVRDIIIAGMRNASNLRIYTAFKYLYDSLMVIDLTMDFFKNPDTDDFYRDVNGDATYREYLRHKDQTLYYKLIEIEMMDDPDSKIQYVANLIDNITYVLEEYIDTEKFEGIFHNLPVISIDAVKQYIKTVIDFYKSYKVHFLGINTMYILDDKYEQWVKIIDEAIFNRFFVKDDIVMINERIAKMLVNMTKKDKLKIIEKVYLDISTWTFNDTVDRCKAKDIATVISRLNLDDCLVIDESFSIESISLSGEVNKSDALNLQDTVSIINSQVNLDDALDTDEKYSVESNFSSVMSTLKKNEIYNPESLMILLSKILLKDSFDSMDTYAIEENFSTIFTTLRKSDEYTIDDSISNLRSHMSIKDTFTTKEKYFIRNIISEITTLIQKKDRYTINDSSSAINANLEDKDEVNLNDLYSIMRIFNKNDMYQTSEEDKSLLDRITAVHTAFEREDGFIAYPAINSMLITVDKRDNLNLRDSAVIKQF